MEAHGRIAIRTGSKRKGRASNATTLMRQNKPLHVHRNTIQHRVDHEGADAFVSLGAFVRTSPLSIFSLGLYRTPVLLYSIAFKAG